MYIYSALDAESEYLVQEALERIMVDRTVLTIAHRLSTIKSADQIAVLDKGQVAEIGSYQDLMKINDGLFRRLVERQTITNEWEVLLINRNLLNVYYSWKLSLSVHVFEIGCTNTVYQKIHFNIFIFVLFFQKFINIWFVKQIFVL